jgi:hypothetical protein
MLFLFRPQSCRFFLNGPFTATINDQLKNLPFDPVNGIRLSYRSCNSECHQSVTIEIDSEGNLSKLSVIDTETNSTDTIFDFANDKLYNYHEQLDLIAGHPLFHMLQQTFPAHYQAGHYAVIVTAL